MWNLVAILLIVWLAGLLRSSTLGGWLHLAPAAAIALAAWLLVRRFRRGKSPPDLTVPS
ncbi:MAG TPA: hypothetical protein VMS56_00250 [Thermoanaerobaculia bacterium]|nr:hypothetical protein [Thermoanaerobaculia bacterium]